jgi:2-polyprenyl-6-methoxyphenol hydroxylase-like FAD-dependent oxidoreductase
LISTLDPGENEQSVLNPSSIERKVFQLLGEGPHEQLWSSVFHIHCRTSPHFRQGRVLLAGDAAHINSPAGGQGMNCGIQDAHNLAWKLARVLAGADAESLLTSYESERRETVLNSVDRYTDLLTRYGLGASEFVRKVTTTLVSFLLRLGVAPSAASIVAIAAPSPSLDPVIRARRPINDKSIEASLLASLHAGRGEVGRVAEIFPLLA